ncbi:MAG: methyl-accepting chemotaxis protein [Deltaproteobacteria bacterium]|nr:methyl-accepting chemotaxis protein [Deltaproteobacteria bacterium]
MRFLGFLRRISIKTFLMGTVSVLVLLLTVLSVNNVLDTYRQNKETKRMDLSNELADHVLAASGFEAKERGVTVIALNSDAAADASVTQKLQDVRAKGDQELKAAEDLSRALLTADSSNSLLRISLDRVEQLKSELESTRTTVDRELGHSGEKNYAAKDWIKFITSVIDTGAELRLAAFASNASKNTLQEALRMNLELKQAVWLVSEYAGRERATLGNFVSSRKPLDPATSEKLNTFRAVVEINLKPILRLKDATGTDAAVLKTVAKMEEVFLGRFNGVRESVYGAASTGKYPITGKEWVASSSEAIDSILDVSAAVGTMVDGKVTPEIGASKRAMAFSIITLAVILCLGAASLWVIKGKVISPMIYINNAMTGIESTNDLTVKIDVNSEDENGQMATAFNRMIEKFHGIIKDIHTSIEHLASSSEELSASAVQIAGGTQSQSAKASQVSTASTEMSATIIEVAKNVSGAADAAKEASSVAVKGGEIVSLTIDSMDGIAKSAKESSRIIATLGSRSQEIGNIVNVIDDIADQTNLLALNAAIEAARAGEQGRGFAVVADEVRKLAEKTMKATREIGDMIKAMQDETGKAIDSMECEVHAVEEGVKLAKDAGNSLKEIVAKVDVVTSMVHQITTATEQQSAATEQISGDIESVADVIRETSSSAQQIARASQEIAELATNLKSTVEVFKTAQEAKVVHIKEEAKAEGEGKVVRLKKFAKAG